MQWIMLGLFAVMIVIMVVVIRKTLKQMNGDAKGVVANTTNLKTAQDFLPFVDVEDDVIDLGGFKYRILVECSSINYALKTDTEQDIIEGSFRKFLNAIQFPISFFIQTKEINYGNIISGLREDIDDAIEDYPQLSEYAEYYYTQIIHLKESMGNTKQKKKYIIIPYEEAVSMTELSGPEKKSYSIKEIHNRANQIIDGLNGLGLVAHIVTTKEVVELLYSMYHRDDDSFVETIGSGEYLTDIVGNGKPPEQTDELKQAIEILQEAENRFRVKIIDHKLPTEANELFNAITQDLSKLKRGLVDIQENGGYDTLKSLEDLYYEGEITDLTQYPNGEGAENEPVKLSVSDFMRNREQGGDM